MRAGFKQVPPDGKVLLGKKSDNVSANGRQTAFIYTKDFVTAIAMYR